MPLTDWFPSRLRGTLSAFFRLGKPSDPASVQWKNNGGAVEARNYDDTAFVVGRGLAPVGTNDWVTLGYLGTAPQAVRTVRFTASGPYTESDWVDGPWYNRTGGALTILDVTAWREFAGTSGQTVVDILLNGTSIWNVTPANRPTILASAGPEASNQVTAFDTATIPANGQLRMAIDEVDVGAPFVTPGNLYVQVTFR